MSVKNTLPGLLLFLIINFTYSQILEPVKWDFSTTEITGSENEYELIFDATIDDKWHLYSSDLPEGGPIPTGFTINESDDFELIDGILEISTPETKFDQAFGMELKLFSEEARFIQKIKRKNSKNFTITGYVEFMSCDDSRCLPPREVEFEIEFKEVIKEKVKEKKEVAIINDSDIKEDDKGFDIVENKITEHVELNEDQAETLEVNIIDEGKNNESLLWYFVLSFIAGLAAILTPCVFPMIPMTVSFFSRSSKSRGSAISNAIYFGLSIVAIYTIIGVLFSVGIFGSDTSQVITTHWIPNTIFFLIFSIFAISFFGAFEIMLPTSLANKADAQADKGGIVGSFFMALTTVIVSFSCTGPFVGALIVEALGGEVIKPVVGMFGFGLAFATPFTLLAIFPEWLKKLPKSGGWMNSVKVFFAFILLAFSLKFISNIDQTYHWDLLSRELYLSIWIVLFILLGFYLLGKIKFSHDSDLQYVGVGRGLLAIASFAFAVYLIPGLFGAPLTSISGVLPPSSSQKFSIVNQMSSNTPVEFDTPDDELCGTAKYADFLHLPHGLKGYFDYDEGMACAKEQNKPVLLDFKGHTCTNCKVMEEKVWSDPQVLKRLKEDYIIIALYVDDRTKLPENEWVTSKFDGKVKKTIGKKNLDIQITKYKTNTQPYYVLADHDGNSLNQARSLTLDVNKFIQFLDEGKKTFYNK